MTTDNTDDKELHALELEAAELDAAVGATAPEARMADAEAAQVVTLADENAQGVVMMLELALPILSTMYPSLANVYHEQARQAIGASLGPVMAKYGINMKEWGGKYQEEMAALIVCGPIALATYKGIRADVEASHAAQRLPAPAREAPAPPAAPVPLRPLTPMPGEYGYREPTVGADQFA